MNTAYVIDPSICLSGQMGVAARVPGKASDSQRGLLPRLAGLTGNQVDLCHALWLSPSYEPTVSPGGGCV